MRTQRPDGAWAPLWFGCQHSPEVTNLTYGTSRVLRLAAVTVWRFGDEWAAALDRGREWLAAAQNPDGGWGGRPGVPSTIEETALSLEAECLGGRTDESRIGAAHRWLAAATANGTAFPPAPIGFYFANLWYYEALYPVIYTVAAMR